MGMIIPSDGIQHGELFLGAGYNAEGRLSYWWEDTTWRIIPGGGIHHRELFLVEGYNIEKYS